MFIYSTWIIRDYECFVVSKQFVCLFSLHIYASSLLKLQITDKTPECMQHTNFVCILCMCMNFCSKKAYSIFSHAAEIIFRFCLICRANSIFFCILSFKLKQWTEKVWDIFVISIRSLEFKTKFCIFLRSVCSTEKSELLFGSVTQMTK